MAMLGLYVPTRARWYAAAQARGVKFGRPPALTVHQRQEATQRLVEISRGHTVLAKPRYRDCSQALSRAQASAPGWPPIPRLLN
jgi:hypothetical protein